MKNLKKVLSVLLVVAMLAATMVPAFAAESFTYEDEAKALYDLKLFFGTSKDEFVPDLGGDLTREQGFAMIVRLLGKLDAANAMSEADIDAVLAAFDDAEDVEATLESSVAYAIKNDLVIGNGDGIDPKGEMLGKDFATVLLRNLGYEVTADSYDKACDLLVEKGGLTAAQAAKFNDKELIRDDFVGMAYGAMQAAYKDGQKIVEKLIADKVITEEAAIKAGVYTKPVAAAATATVVGAKKFEVKFNTAVADTTKATIKVKKGSIGYNVSKLTWAEDKKSVVVEMASNITKGDYEVTVSGLTETELVAKVSAEDEKVTKIDFTSDLATLVRDSEDLKVNAFFKVYNQYNEAVTGSYSYTFTTSRGNVATTATAGMLEITDTTKFAKDQKVALSVLHVASGTFGSAVLTVTDKAQVADVAIKSLVLKDSKELDIDKASVIGDYKLEVEAKDQYGNVITNDASIESDVIVTVTDPTVVTVKNGKTTGSNISGEVYMPDFTVSSSKVYLQLAQAKDASGSDVGLRAGTTTVRIISKLTGKIATFDVVVKDGVKADVITLSAPELAPAGEKINIPFTAIDQFGNAITDATKGLTALNPKVTVTGGATAEFKQDYVKGVPVLELNATSAAKGPVTLTIVTATLIPKVYSLTINLTDAKEGKVISSTKDFKTSMLKSGYAVMTKSNVVMKDQYGRNMSIDLTKYNVEFKTSDKSKVVLVDNTGAELSTDKATITNANQKIFLKAKAKGSSTITLRLYDVANASFVSGSDYTFSMNVVENSDIVSYEMEEISKVFDVAGTSYAEADYAKAIKVNGILADGAKVAIPAELYSTKVVLGDVNLSKLVSVTDNVYTVKVGSDGVNLGGTDKEKTFSVVVTVEGNNGPAVLTKQLTVSNVKPNYETLSLVSVSDSGYTSEGNNVVSVTGAIADVDAFVEAVVKAVDQYGVELKDTTSDTTIESYTSYVTNLPSGKTAATVVSGDTFNVTAVTANGKSISFKVIVK